MGSYSHRSNSHRDTGRDHTDRNHATRSIVNMNANTNTQRTNAQGRDHTHDHGSYHWNGRDDNHSMTSIITSIPTTVADRDRGSHAGESNTNTCTDTNSNFNSIANYRPHTPPQKPDSTLKLKEIIGSLSTVLGLVKNLDSLDTVQESEMWKERAFFVEVNITSLKDEIESLKNGVTVWENRTKRIEKRCDWCE